MIAVTSIFSLVALMVWSRVRSKLWVGLSGLLSAFFGIVSALGVMMAVGVPFIAVVGAMPFLIFGEHYFANALITLKYTIFIVGNRYIIP